MTIAPTAGIAAAWSAAKTTPSDQASQPAPERQATLEASPRADEPKKSPPPPEGQGTRLDVRV
jgi:hypothetical protein